jgi:hypothetical protein
MRINAKSLPPDFKVNKKDDRDPTPKENSFTVQIQDLIVDVI